MKLAYYVQFCFGLSVLSPRLATQAVYEQKQTRWNTSLIYNGITLKSVATSRIRTTLPRVSFVYCHVSCIYLHVLFLWLFIIVLLQLSLFVQLYRLTMITELLLLRIWWRCGNKRKRLTHYTAWRGPIPYVCRDFFSIVFQQAFLNGLP